MSFDLYFCWQTNSRFNSTRLAEFFGGIPNFQTNHLQGGNLQVWYENESTGVYFPLEFEEEPADREPPVILPAGFFDTGISFNLNFNRPCFFAHEAMPWVETLAGELDLWIVDPQEGWDAEPNVPKRYSAAELIASWERSNTRAVAALHDKGKSEEQFDYRYCPREKSLYWWNYAREKDKLQKCLGDSVFVPTLAFYVKGKEPTIQTAFVWSDALPQVFPQADLVIHNRIGRNWKGERVSKKLQVLPFADVVVALEHLLIPCESAVPGLRYLRPEDSKEIGKIFGRLKGTSFIEFQRVAPDGFVDVVLRLDSEVKPA